MTKFNKSRLARTFSGLLLAAAVASGSHAQAFASGSGIIKDIALSSDYAKQSILNLADAGIIVGDQNGNFDPRRPVKRAELAVMLVKALKLDTSNPPQTPTFRDVPANHWAYRHVEAAYKAGIIKGVSAEKLDPAGICTREQMAVMFVRALGLTDEALRGQQSMARYYALKDRNLVSPWARDHVEFTLHTGLMTGTGGNRFAPGKGAERQQVAIITERLMNRREAVTRFANTFKGQYPDPELYQAIKDNGTAYEGSAAINLELNFKDTAGNDLSNLHMGMTGQLDTAASTMDFNYEVKAGNGENTAYSQKFRVVRLQDRYFILYDGQDTWMEAPPSMVGQDDSAPVDESADTLLKHYRYFTVEKTENAVFQGKSVVKYTLTLSPEAAKDLISGTLSQAAGQDSSSGSDEESLSGLKNLSGKTVIYLDDKNQVLYERTDLSSRIWDQELGTDVVLSVLLEVDYFGRGQEVNIQAPEGTIAQ